MSTSMLEEMGIRNADNITRYKLKQKRRDKDQLDIFYQRKTGSLLPVKRTYEFGRANRSTSMDSDSAKREGGYEISPLLLKAVGELDQLLKREDAEVDQQELMLMELENMKRLVKAGETPDVVKEKLQALLKTL